MPAERRKPCCRVEVHFGLEGIKLPFDVREPWSDVRCDLLAKVPCAQEHTCGEAHEYSDEDLHYDHRRPDWQASWVFCLGHGHGWGLPGSMFTRVVHRFIASLQVGEVDLSVALRSLGLGVAAHGARHYLLRGWVSSLMVLRSTSTI